MKPGEYLLKGDDIILNQNAKTLVINVANLGDRPIQVGSHYHFYEVNEALQFEREKTIGHRLDIPAGTGMRFEPGQERKVQLIRLPPNSKIFGFNGKIMGSWEAKA